MASYPSIPNSFVARTLIQASKHNENWDYIEAAFNGGTYRYNPNELYVNGVLCISNGRAITAVTGVFSTSVKGGTLTLSTNIIAADAGTIQLGGSPGNIVTNGYIKLQDARIKTNAGDLELQAGSNVINMISENLYIDNGEFKINGGSSGTEFRIETTRAQLRFIIEDNVRFDFNTAAGPYLDIAQSASDIAFTNSGNNYLFDKPIKATSFVQANYLKLIDGITAPTATVGEAKIYVDTADGDLKVIFGDGFVRVIAADS